MEKSFSGCEVVELGIQIEKNGRDFYSELASSAKEKKVIEVLEYLAEAEEKHIEVFKEIFSGMCDYSPDAVYPQEYFAYMNALASQHVFTGKDKGKEAAGKIKDYDEGIDMGIGFEKDSILFFQEMEKIVPEKDRELVEKIILEEKKHLKKLLGLKKGCGNEECKSI